MWQNFSEIQAVKENPALAGLLFSLLRLPWGRQRYYAITLNPLLVASRDLAKNSLLSSLLQVGQIRRPPLL